MTRQQIEEFISACGSRGLESMVEEQAAGWQQKGEAENLCTESQAQSSKSKAKCYKAFNLKTLPRAYFLQQGCTA